MQSIFNFCFSAKTFQIADRTTQEGEGGVHSHVNFLPLAPFPQIPFPPCEFFFFAPDPLPPLPRYTSLERRKQEIRIYRVVTFPNMNDLGAEYTKDLVITQRKTDSEVSLLLKERFPGKKGRGQLRGLFREWNTFTQLPVKWWAWAVHAGRRCSGNYKFIRLKCLLFAIFFFFLPSFLCLHSCLYEYPSGFKTVFQLLPWICRLLSRLIFFQAVNEQLAHVFNTQNNLLTVLKGIKHLMRTKQHQKLYFSQNVSLRLFPF